MGSLVCVRQVKAGAQMAVLSTKAEGGLLAA